MVKEKSAQFGDQQSLGNSLYEGMNVMENREREKWTGLVGTGVRSTHSWTCSSPSFIPWQQCNLPSTFNITQSRADSPSYGFTFSPQFPGPLPVSAGPYITRDWVNFLPIGLPIWLSGNCLYEPVTLTKHILRFYKDNIVLRRPRCDMNNFLLAKSFKVEEFFSPERELQ